MNALEEAKLGAAPRGIGFVPSLGGLTRESTGVLLVVLAAGPAYATLLAAAGAAIQPIGLDYGEPIVYGDVLRVLHGQALYQPIATPPYTVAAYTPLYYIVAAAVQQAIGGGFTAGRALSLAAGLVAALAAGVIAARQARTPWVGGLAAVLFLGLAFPGGTPWLGLYRVDALGVALSVAAVGVLGNATSTRGLLVAGVLAGLAVLCKQTLVAATLAGMVWLWPHRGRLRVFAGAAIATVAIPCAFLQVTTGAFVENALAANLNPFDGSLALRLLRELAVAQWLPLLLTVVYLVLSRPWRSAHGRLLVMYWLVSALSLVGLAKVGANHNYWLEFAAATAALGALGALTLLSARRPLAALAGGLAMVTLLGGTLGHGFVQMAVGGLGAMRSEVYTVESEYRSVRAGAPDADFALLVQRVHDEPGLVLADPLDVEVLADRPVYFEPLIYSILLDQGRWSAAPLVQQICGGEVGLLVLGYPLEDANTNTFGEFGTWPRPVLEALRNTMQPAGEISQRRLYTPRPASGAIARAC